MKKDAEIKYMQQIDLERLTLAVSLFNTIHSSPRPEGKRDLKSEADDAIETLKRLEAGVVKIP